MIHKIRSLFKLCWIILRESVAVVAALVRADALGAARHARTLAETVHNDLLLIAAGLQHLLPLWRVPKPGIERILIVKLDRIGDMVTTTPVFDALHALFPEARLDIVGHPTSLTLLDGDERIGERFAYRCWLYHPLPLFPPGLRDWLIVFKLLWRRYPLVVYLRGSFPFLLLGITSRLAATKFIVAQPVIDRYMKALEVLFGPLPQPQPRLHIDSAAMLFAHELLSSSGSEGGPCVVIHPTASAVTKSWPADRFAALADILFETHHASIHFVGSPAERATFDNIARLAVHAHAFHCSLQLSQVAAVIATADLFIGNDSGLAHIAAAVGTRLVILWGPANLIMARPKSAPERCIILYHDLRCRERCPEVQCVNSVAFECLTRTQVGDVVAAVQRLLQPTAAEIGRQEIQLCHSTGLATANACAGQGNIKGSYATG